MSILPNSHSNQSTKLACAQAGCPDCLEALLIQHKKLIYIVVHRQYPGKSDYADLIQAGWIGLWQAILHFDHRHSSHGTVNSRPLGPEAGRPASRSARGTTRSGGRPPSGDI